MRFEPIPKPAPSRFWIARRLWSMAGVIFAVLFLFFFWALPQIGHHILLRNNYYGLIHHPAANYKNVKCEDSLSGRVDGHFLGIYPYTATISSGCLFNFNSLKNDSVFVEIRVRKPRVPIKKDRKDRSELIASSFESVLYTIHPMAVPEDGILTNGR